MGFFVIGVVIVIFAGLYAGYGLRQTPATLPPSWMWWLVGLAVLCFRRRAGHVGLRTDVGVHWRLPVRGIAGPLHHALNRVLVRAARRSRARTAASPDAESRGEGQAPDYAPACFFANATSRSTAVTRNGMSSSGGRIARRMARCSIARTTTQRHIRFVSTGPVSWYPRR